MRFLLRASALLIAACLSSACAMQPVVPAPIPQPPVPPPKTVPVLMYHYVRTVDESADPLGYNLSIDPVSFETHMRWLSENGYHTMTASDIVNGTIQEKPVWLTFDDGYEDFYTAAYPILQKYGFTATTAIIIDKINQPGYMTEEQLRELLAHSFEIASHTFSHPQLTDLYGERLQHEIADSKKTLEDRFGITVVTFVYPSGKYNQTIEDKVKEAGYHFAFTVKPGVRVITDNQFDLPRLRIDNRVSLTTFSQHFPR